jgi:hypothetical protein
MAATRKGTRRRRRIELDTLDRAARQHLAARTIPAAARRRRVERLHADLVAGRVQLPAA